MGDSNFIPEVDVAIANFLIILREGFEVDFGEDAEM